MTHDPREALEIVQQMIRGKPMSAWITDTRTMKSLGDVVQEALTASPGGQKPVAWRMRLVAGVSAPLGWEYLSNQPSKHPRYEVEPLYLSPPPAAGWDIESVADAIDLARYQPPSNPSRTRPRPFSEADRSDREYATRLAKAALKALRREAPAPEGVAPTHIDSGGRAVIEGGDVVIRFPLDAMQSAIDGAWSLKIFDTRYKITNIDEFSKEFVYALNREDEQGTTNIHRLADKAFIDCIESGAFGIEEHEQQEI